jgi:hypothetical protein
VGYRFFIIYGFMGLGKKDLIKGERGVLFASEKRKEKSSYRPSGGVGSCFSADFISFTG